MLGRLGYIITKAKTVGNVTGNAEYIFTQIRCTKTSLKIALYIEGLHSTCVCLDHTVTDTTLVLRDPDTMETVGAQLP